MDTRFEELADKAKRLAQESAEGLGERLGSLKDSEDWEQLRRLAGDLGEDAASFVRKYPLQSVLGAAAAGFVLGALLGGRRR